MSDGYDLQKPAEQNGPARSNDQYVREDTGKAQSAFDKARSNAEPQKQQDKPERVESQQVKNTAPGMNGPQPPAQAKNAMARETHNSEKAKDAERARQMAENIKKENRDQPDVNKDKGQER